MKATAKDLRFYSKELLETVARGEEVIITYRGKPYAKLIPIGRNLDQSPSKIELFGIWENYDKIDAVEQYIRDLRKGRF